MLICCRIYVFTMTSKKKKIRLDIRQRLLGLHQKPVNRIVFCRQKREKGNSVYLDKE